MAGAAAVERVEVIVIGGGIAGCSLRGPVGSASGARAGAGSSARLPRERPFRGDLY